MKKIILIGAILTCFVMLGMGAPQKGFSKEVVLYSSNQSDLIDMVSQGFEKKTGIKVSAVRMGTGEAMKRIQAEKDNPLGGAEARDPAWARPPCSARRILLG